MKFYYFISLLSGQPFLILNQDLDFEKGNGSNANNKNTYFARALTLYVGYFFKKAARSFLLGAAGPVRIFLVLRQMTEILRFGFKALQNENF